MLSRFAVLRPVTTAMFFTAAVLLGLVSYRQLAIQLLPDITLPAMGIAVHVEGQATDLLDRVTRPIEEQVSQIPRVKEVVSFTRNNTVWVRVDFEQGTDMKFAVIDVEERLDAWRRRLDDRRLALYVFPFSTESFQTEFMDMSLQVEDPTLPFSDDLVERIEENLKSIQGVARVEVHGRVSDSVRVVFDPDRLRAYALGFGGIVSSVAAAAAEQPDLGLMKTPTGHVFVRLGDRIRTPEQLAEIPVEPNGVLRLRDVADIHRGGALESTVFRTDGRVSIGLAVGKEADVNLVRLARVVRARVAELNDTLPSGYRLVINRDDARIIEDILDEMIRLALLGALLAGFVPLLFLRSIRMAAIVFLSIPISLIATFNIMYGVGLSINVLTVIALAIGVSILVDNSIVVLENGFRLAERGLDPKEAAGRGGQEVGRALLASTTTTLAVFVPIFFAEGEIRLIFREGALAIAFPLLISLTVALSLVPVLTAGALRMRQPGHRGPFARWLDRAVAGRVRALWPWKHASGRLRALPRELYRAVLKRVIRYRGRTLLLIAGLCAFTVVEQRATLDRSTFQREARREFMRFFVQYPRGSRLSQADVAVRQVEDALASHPAVNRFWVQFDDEQARFWVRLKPMRQRPDRMTFQEFERTLFEFIGPVPGATLARRGREQPLVEDTLDYGEGGEIELRGPDLHVLLHMAERVESVLATFPAIVNTELDLREENPEIEVRLDRERAALFDVSAATVAQYVRSTRSSGTLAEVKLDDAGRLTDVVFEMGGPQRETLDDIRALPIESPEVGAIPFAEVATFQPRFTSHRFRRTNGQQTLQVRFFVRPGTRIDRLSDDVLAVLRQIPNPGGVALEIAGQERDRRQRETEASTIFFLGLILVFIVMAFVFESVWVPLTIMMSVPLVSIGVIWILLLTGKSFDEMAQFGMIVLAGLVVNAPIVMLDLTQRLRYERGYNRIRAVFQACDRRLRPVTMTVMTTILGLAPLAFLPRESDEWSNMALVVIGGLTSSTLLTLLVIPCFYLAIEDVLARGLRPALWFVFHRLAFAFRLLDFLLQGLFFRLPALFWRERGWRVWLWPQWTAVGGAAGAVATWRWLRAWPVWRWAWNAACWSSACLAAAALIPMRRWRRTPSPSPEPLAAINREIPIAPARKAKPTTAAETHPTAHARRSEGVSEGEIEGDGPDAAPLRVQNLRVIYPIRRLRDIANLVPSTRHPIGCRPVVGVEALRGIDLTIRPGLYGLLGPNGAGKTTLMRCLAGLLPPTRGTVRVFGAPLREHPEALAPLIAYLPQFHGLYDTLTLRETLEYFLLLRMRAQGHALERRTIDRAVVSAAEEVHLLDVLDRPLGTYSGGMRQRAGLARVLLAPPPIVLVDEPTAGLDPIERVKVRLLLAQMARTRTVVFSTHLVEDLELSCEAVGILRDGRLLYSGPPAALLTALEGRVWEVPLLEDGEIPRAALERIESRLFRVADADGARWRCLAPAAPTPDSRPARPRLEDAFLDRLNRLHPAAETSTPLGIAPSSP